MSRLRWDLGPFPHTKHQYFQFTTARTQSSLYKPRTLNHFLQPNSSFCFFLLVSKENKNFKCPWHSASCAWRKSQPGLEKGEPPLPRPPGDGQGCQESVHGRGGRGHPAPRQQAAIRAGRGYLCRSFCPCEHIFLVSYCGFGQPRALQTVQRKCVHSCSYPRSCRGIWVGGRVMERTKEGPATGRRGLEGCKQNRLDLRTRADGN